MLGRRKGTGVFNRHEVPLAVYLLIYAVMTALRYVRLSCFGIRNECSHKPVALRVVTVGFDDGINLVFTLLCVL